MMKNWTIGTIGVRLDMAVDELNTLASFRMTRTYFVVHLIFTVNEIIIPKLFLLSQSRAWASFHNGRNKNYVDLFATLCSVLLLSRVLHVCTATYNLCCLKMLYFPHKNYICHHRKLYLLS